MVWTDACVVASFLTNGESVTATLRNFRKNLKLSRHDPVSDQKTLELQAQRSSRNPLEDQEAFKLQRTFKFLKSLFCDLKGVQLVSILLH